MTWTSFHNRGDVLRNVETAAEQRRDGVLPMDLDGVRDHFADELDLIAALMLRWHARLSGNIERALMDQPMDLAEAVARAWADTAAAMPGVRAIIDRHTDFPADDETGRVLARAQEKEWLKLAAAAGLSNDEGRAAMRAGSQVQSRARASLAPTTPVNPAGSATAAESHPIPEQAAASDAPVSFVDRIKAVIAA